MFQTHYEKVERAAGQSERIALRLALAFISVAKIDKLVKSLLTCHCEERSDEAIS